MRSIPKTAALRAYAGGGRWEVACQTRNPVDVELAFGAKAGEGVFGDDLPQAPLVVEREREVDVRDAPFAAHGARALPFCVTFRGCCTIRGYTHGKEQKKFTSLLAFRPPALPLLHGLADIRDARGSFLPRLLAFLSFALHYPSFPP